MQKRQKERGEEIIILYRELVMLLDSSKLAYHVTAAYCAGGCVEKTVSGEFEN